MGGGRGSRSLARPERLHHRADVVGEPHEQVAAPERPGRREHSVGDRAAAPRHDERGPRDAVRDDDREAEQAEHHAGEDAGHPHHARAILDVQHGRHHLVRARVPERDELAGLGVRAPHLPPERDGERGRDRGEIPAQPELQAWVEDVVLHQAARGRPRLGGRRRCGCGRFGHRYPRLVMARRGAGAPGPLRCCGPRRPPPGSRAARRPPPASPSWRGRRPRPSRRCGPGRRSR